MTVVHDDVLDLELGEDRDEHPGAGQGVDQRGDRPRAVPERVERGGDRGIGGAVVARERGRRRELASRHGRPATSSASGSVNAPA